MGDGTIGAAVGDAGPLIHLNEIGCLSLLRLFSVVYVPETVWIEAARHAAGIEEQFSESDTIRRRSLQNANIGLFVHDNKLETLHGGEIECLYFSLELKIPLILTDDLSVRDVAKRMGLVPVGSLGVVVRN